MEKNTGHLRLRIATITKLIMASQEILILLGVVVFFFSALGMQLWGGTLYATHPALEGGARKRPTFFNMVALEYDEYKLDLVSACLKTSLQNGGIQL